MSKEKAKSKLWETEITIDIMYYHPEDENGNVDESKKVYDFEGMANEFENRLSELDERVVVMCSVSTEDAEPDTNDNDWSNFNSPPKF